MVVKSEGTGKFAPFLTCPNCGGKQLPDRDVNETHMRRIVYRCKRCDEETHGR